jgi:hypothetical protein
MDILEKKPKSGAKYGKRDVVDYTIARVIKKDLRHLFWKNKSCASGVSHPSRDTYDVYESSYIASDEDEYIVRVLYPWGLKTPLGEIFGYLTAINDDNGNPLVFAYLAKDLKILGTYTEYFKGEPLDMVGSYTSHLKGMDWGILEPLNQPYAPKVVPIYGYCRTKQFWSPGLRDEYRDEEGVMKNTDKHMVKYNMYGGEMFRGHIIENELIAHNESYFIDGRRSLVPSAWVKGIDRVNNLSKTSINWE